LTIVPIFRRELMAAARRGRLQWDRSFFAAILLAIVLGTFGSWYYREGWHASHHLMSGVAIQSFNLILAVHGIYILGSATMGAVAIAGEKDRRTLDFLLATRLGNAEIVVGKLAACLTGAAMTVAAGLPVVLLLYLLGGVDPWLILLAYAGVATTVFFVVALAIWISTGAPDARRATGVTTLCIIAWLFVPFLVSMFLPRLGLVLPHVLMIANAWVLASSPLGLVLKFAMGGLTASTALVDSAAWMGGLQAAAGLILLAGAVARLRSAYRVNLGGDGHALGAARKRPFWRFRPRPPVGDDPILWREMYTARGGILLQLFGLLCVSAPYAALVYSSYFFARRAFAELWRNGYATGLTSAAKPEFNLMLRFFFTESPASAPVDLARTDLNLFLRSVTTPFVFLLAIMTAGIAAEAVTSERIRETWNSLIATPLTARDILRSKLLACTWRMRGLLVTLLVLWTIGLLAGAIHPLGYFLTLLELAAWTWFLLVLGLRASVRAQDPAAAAGATLSLTFLPIASGVLPFLLPAKLSSVVLGVASIPFVTWLSLVSYRDVRAALHYAVYPHLAWAGIATGEGPVWVLTTCLLGIIVPALGGLWGWRYLIANFDRLIGRPSPIKG
jgi:ABC-type transport system involved in multi-copper enzyme maturation permease subunit